MLKLSTILFRSVFLSLSAAKIIRLERLKQTQTHRHRWESIIRFEQFLLGTKQNFCLEAVENKIFFTNAKKVLSPKKKTHKQNEKVHAASILLISSSCKKKNLRG